MKLIGSTYVLLPFLNVVVSRPRSFWSQSDTSLQDVKLTIDDKVSSMELGLSLLAERFTSVADTDVKIKVTDRIESFRKVIAKVSEDAYLYAIEKCTGNNTILQVTSQCLKDPRNHIDDTFDSLDWLISDFRTQSYLYLVKASEVEEDSSPENHLDQKNITTGDVLIEFKENVKALRNTYYSLENKFDGLIMLEFKRDLEQEFFNEYFTFGEVIGALAAEAYKDVMRLCNVDDFNAQTNIPCSQNPIKNTRQIFKPIYKMMEEFSEKLFNVAL